MTPLQSKGRARPEQAETRKPQDGERTLLCRRMEQCQGLTGKSATARFPAGPGRCAGPFRGENVAHVGIGSGTSRSPALQIRILICPASSRGDWRCWFADRFAAGVRANEHAVFSYHRKGAFRSERLGFGRNGSAHQHEVVVKIPFVVSTDELAMQPIKSQPDATIHTTLQRPAEFDKPDHRSMLRRQ